jgi:hypothetical protein
MKTLAPLLLLVLSLPGPTGPGELVLEHNPENVVGSRLAGRWTVAAELSSHLRGRPVAAGSEALEFRADPAVVGAIPADYHEFLADQPLYLAGQLVRARGTDPFVLTTLNGNPHVIVFRPEGGRSHGAVESFNLALAPAMSPADDLLFVGGDFNGQPFLAYERVSATR